MAGETPITLVGNLVEDPILRYTTSGSAVANFRVASTPRRFDSQSNQWVDGDALFLTCNVWRQAAENVANSLTKGDRVIVTGRLRQRSFEKDGERRTVFEVEVDDVGPSLKYATTQVARTPRQGGPTGGWGGGGGQTHQPTTGHPGGTTGPQQGIQQGQQGSGRAGQQQDDDPWAGEQQQMPDGDQPPF